MARLFSLSKTILSFIIILYTGTFAYRYKSGTVNQQLWLSAIGKRHAIEHFRSPKILSSSIRFHRHLLQEMSMASLCGAKYTSVEHPYVACTSVKGYNASIANLENLVRKRVVAHTTYNNAREDRVCFVATLNTDAILPLRSRDISELGLRMLSPIPHSLKLDTSILHAMDYLLLMPLHSSSKNTHFAGEEEESGYVAFTSNSAKKSTGGGVKKNDRRHPILNSISEDAPLELSIIFRSAWSTAAAATQEDVVRSWEDVLPGRNRHRQQQQHHTAATSDSSSNGNEEGVHRTSSSSRASATTSESSCHWDAFHWTSHVNGGLVNSTKSSIKKDTIHSLATEDGQHLETWQSLRRTFEAIQARGDAASTCRFDELLFRHRKEHIIISLPNGFFKLGAESAACLAHLVVLAATEPGVSRVGLSRPLRTQNNYVRGIVQSGQKGNEPYTSAGLDGTGIVIGIADTGIDESSCYFSDLVHGEVPHSDVENPTYDLSYRKIVQYVNYSGSNGDYNDGHGSHVSGTLAGYCSSQFPNAPSNANNYRGMASSSKIAFFDIGSDANSGGFLYVPSDISEWMFPAAYQAGARVYSNSWGGGYWYDAYCIEVDRYLYETTDFMVFFAAGNDGDSGYGTVLSPSLSKNAVAVAASQTTHSGGQNIGNMASFSALGPAPDGRYKPDITAPGYDTFSVKSSSEDNERASCSTEAKAGTSMATPAVAGNAALIQQYFEDSNYWANYCDKSYALCIAGSFTPSGALLKGLILQSGDQMSSYPGGGTVRSTKLSTPPDIFQGFGRVDLQNILPLTAAISSSSSHTTLFIDETYVTQLTERTYTISVTSTSTPLKVTLVWMDPPNVEFAAKVLLHDLDLVVESPSGSQYLGNGKGQSSGVTRDELNTNEQVLITSSDGLVNGDWTVRVQGKLLTETPYQNYSIVLTATGKVTSAPSELTSVSPTVLQQCQSVSNPAMSVYLSLWDMANSDGWSSDDVYAIYTLDISDVLTQTQDAYSEVSANTFTDHSDYETRAVCLSTGCYVAQLTLGKNTQAGTQFSIPQCNTFLAPLRYAEPFCVDEPSSYNETYTATDGSTKTRAVLEFPETACYSACDREAHVSVSTILAEWGGTGWGGAYYAVHTMGSNDTSIPITSPWSRMNAVAAGTLEWNYAERQYLCLSNERGGALGSCYTIQLSIPEDSEFLPSLEFEGAWFVPDGVNDDPSTPCPYMIKNNVSFGVICIEDSGNYGTVEFYFRNTTSLGQTPYTSYAEFDTYQALDYHKYPVGKCRFNTTVSAASSPFAGYEYYPGEPTPTPTTSPSATPTLTDYPTPIATNAPSAIPTVAPTTSSPTTAIPTVSPTALLISHNYTCFRGCDGYPGDHVFTQLKYRACEFLMLDAFYLCGSYAISIGSCSIPTCMADCGIEDYCYFGAGASTGCPTSLWSRSTDNSSAVKIFEECVASMTAASTSAGGGKSTDGDTGNDGSDASGGVTSRGKGLSRGDSTKVTLAVLFSGLGSFVVAVVIFFCLRYRRTSSSSSSSSSGQGGADRPSLLRRVQHTRLRTTDEASVHDSKAAGTGLSRLEFDEEDQISSSLDQQEISHGRTAINAAISSNTSYSGVVSNPINAVAATKVINSHRPQHHVGGALEGEGYMANINDSDNALQGNGSSQFSAVALDEDQEQEEYVGEQDPGAGGGDAANSYRARKTGFATI